MLRNGVNHYGLYGNLRTCFGVENEGHKLNKNCLPCLLDLLPVFVRHILAILVRFQWVFKGLLKFLRSISCHVCPRKVGHFSSNSFRCNVNNDVSIKSKSRTKDCGPRTGYKRETKVSGGLRTTDYGLRTGFKGVLKSENHIFLVFILSKFNMYQIKFR